MESKSEIRSNIDNSKLLVKLSLIGGSVTLVLLIVLMFIGVGSDTFVRSDLFALGLVPYIMALLFSISALLYGILSTGAAQEEEEKLLLSQRKSSSESILNVEEDVRFTAGRTFNNYRQYAPYVLGILGSVVIAGTLFWFYRYWNAAQLETVAKVMGQSTSDDKFATPTQIAVLSIIFMAVSAFLGAFFNGQSRNDIFRWLRPVGAWLSMGFLLMFFSTLGALFKNWDIFAWYDNFAVKLFFILFIILGAELIVNFVIEFYRPRTIKESRPIFESKFLSIFTEPGGVMRNIAETLDYQFGFKVSGTWIYSFIEKGLFPLIVVWALILWGFTSFHIVKIGEVGIQEEFGKVASRELLEPGIYVTAPWPIGTIKTFSCMQLKQIFVGEDPTKHKVVEEVDTGHHHGPKPKKKKVHKEDRRFITWTKTHSHSEKGPILFMVSNNGDYSKNHNTKSSNAVDLIAFSMPVQYRILKNKIFDYAYLNNNPEMAIKHISEEVTINLLASASLTEVMSTGRKEFENAVKKRIQEEIDREKIGVEIVTVNLTDAHPPLLKDTSKAFHEERIAQEQAAAAILGARVYSDRVIPEAEVNFMRIKGEADSYEYNMRKIADAESNRFATQLKSYKVMPEMFMLKTYLEFLEEDCADIRKFIISASIKNEIYEFNFEEKGALDLMDVDMENFGTR